MSLTHYDKIHGAVEPTKTGQQIETLINKIVAAGMKNQRAAHTIVSTVARELSLLGVGINAQGRVDVFELNKAFRESGAHYSPEKRIAIKSMLAQCSLID